MSRSILLLLLLASSLLAQSIAGDWTYSMDTPNGEVKAKMALTVSGQKVTGSFTFDGNRKIDIQEGSWDGKQLKLTVKRDRPAGGSIVYKMTGALEGNKITGTTLTDLDGQQADGQWSAVRN